MKRLVASILICSSTFTHETVSDWEARFAPLIADQLRAKRCGQARVPTQQRWNRSCKRREVSLVATPTVDKISEERNAVVER